MKVVNINTKEARNFRNLEKIVYHSLFDNLIDGILIINEFGIVEYYNESYRNFFLTDSNLQIGDNIFNRSIDSITLNSFKNKENKKGTIIYQSDAFYAEVLSWCIYRDDNFKGIISHYRKIEDFSLVNADINNYNIHLLKPFQKIISNSLKMKEALLVAQKASKTSSNILIIGESGTGKELVAKAIHQSSNRANKAFIAVNCGAIPSTLLESELFGHEQGAFTGAIKQKLGKFELANGGTIFLDEIGDLPLSMQVKLLRIIQEREFERVGGVQTVKVDVRIIAATNKDLLSLVLEGKFREDLYYRLNVIPIYLPPLKERKEDIPLLFEHFSEKISSKLNKKPIILSDDAMRCLGNYDWPGNIRELENFIERLIVLTEKEIIDVYDLPPHIANICKVFRQNNENSSLIKLKSNGDLATFEEYERDIIKLAIEKFGSFNAAGKALGITHKTVAHKARKYNIID